MRLRSVFADERSERERSSGAGSLLREPERVWGFNLLPFSLSHSVCVMFLLVSGGRQEREKERRYCFGVCFGVVLCCVLARLRSPHSYLGRTTCSNICILHMAWLLSRGVFFLCVCVCVCLYVFFFLTSFCLCFLFLFFSPICFLVGNSAV